MVFSVCICCVVDDRLCVLEDAVPGKQLNEVEERRQELIGELSGVLVM